jgi:hypothetical protein
MTRLALLFIVLGLVSLAPRVAAAQGGLAGPGLEVGADFGLGLPDGDPVERHSAIGPRMTTHLTPRNSITFFGDATSSRVGDRSWYRMQMFGFSFRRALYEAGGFSFRGLAGAGVSRQQTFTASFPSVGPGNVPIVIPDTLRSSVQPLALFGVNVEQRLTSRLAVHGDVMLVGSEGASEYRVQAGFSVPLRPYASREVAASTAYGQTPLRIGQKLWITGGTGDETSGKISAIDNSRIELDTTKGRVAFARADIRQIALPDSLVNGTGIGAGIGAAALGGFVSWLNVALCESDDGCQSLAPALLGGAYGAAIGGVAGALVDSLIDGRRIVFGSKTVRVAIAPSLARHQAGGRVALTW